jgi:hypothetical protein
MGCTLTEDCVQIGLQDTPNIQTVLCRDGRRPVKVGGCLLLERRVLLVVEMVVVKMVVV